MTRLSEELTLALTLKQKRNKAPGTVYVYPNSMGGWCAEITLPQPLSEEDFAAQMPQFEGAARTFIIQEMTRLQVCWAKKTYPNEDFARNKRQLQSGIENLVIAQKTTNAQGLLSAIIFRQ